MGLRIFLGLSALVWIAYGVYCLIEPGFLEGAAGVASSTSTGTTELRAMYGGVQIAIGSMMAAALLRPHLAAGALTALAFLCAGLFSTRLVGAVVDSSFSSYTVSALGFEIVLLGLSVWFLTRAPSQTV